MIYKINGKAPKKTNTSAKTLGCDAARETSNSKTQIKINGTAGMKQQVANYKKVMRDDFKMRGVECMRGGGYQSDVRDANCISFDNLMSGSVPVTPYIE